MFNLKKKDTTLKDATLKDNRILFVTCIKVKLRFKYNILIFFIGEQMNRFINENSELIFKELQTAYEETFSLVFTKIDNEIFNRIPFDKIFPPK